MNATTLEPMRNNSSLSKRLEKCQEPSVATSDTIADFDTAPDGGVQAWLVAAGGSSIFFSCLGFANAFGTFQQYYKSHQLSERSEDQIAWIGSLSLFLTFLVGAIGGPLFDRYGAWMMRPAAVLYILAVMMTSLCTKYWHFMLAQGILPGICSGLLQFPAMTAVSHWFDKKRAAALGVVVAGSSLGGVVVPIALSKMLNGSSLGFAWSVRIIGFLIMPFLLFSCFAVKPRLPPRRTNFFIGGAFKDKAYTLLIVSMFFMFLGMFTPLFFIPTYAVSRGIDPTLASYLLAILNGASTFGRIIPGVLADVYGRLNMFAFAGLSTGIVVLCMTAARSTPGLVVYAIIFGFTSGAIISGASAAFSVTVKDIRKMGTYMGMGMGVASLAALMGPPVNGAIVHKYGGFLEVTIFSGIMSLVGGIAALGAKAATPKGILGNI
ncbi:MFS general substrate transporter [Aaosphaeria arxii CBS 175.79]|uniref:MFS general substrate transporter n=1 Tax=Aaosphaeria arxii CBS 175.79 TaxID=1450172 RepID=A0A6A5XER9_9PLEO|nr:MFS general substrate transporter [Aaosphaeria arxii CBS 175.79]KAF2011582.1 MFS general substrate transporter [Aaosphaeria arxii CBS 175.79]